MSPYVSRRPGSGHFPFPFGRIVDFQYWLREQAVMTSKLPHSLTSFAIAMYSREFLCVQSPRCNNLGGVGEV